MLHIQRKKVIRPLTLFAFALMIYSATRSQKVELFQLDHESKPYYFGITLGANIARFQIEQHPRFLQYDSVLEILPLNSPGFGLGLNATARLTNRFEARFNPQLMFTDRSITYKLKYKDPIDGFEPTKKIESVIFTFPFQIKFNSDRIGNFRVYMLGGAFTQIDLAANARARRAEDLVKLESSDYGVEIGMGFNFYFPSFIFSPEIKVSNGLRNLHSRDVNLKYSNVLDRIQSRMIVFSIHLEG